MLFVIDLGEISDPNPLLWSKLHGSNHLIRKCLVGVIPEVNLAHPRSETPSDYAVLFIAVLGHLSGLNKFCHCGQSCRGLRHLSFDAKSTLIASVFQKIWSFEVDCFSVMSF